MGSYSQNKCDFFNAYMLKKDDVALGTYGGLFVEEYEASEAVLPGWVNGEYWSIESSWSFTIEAGWDGYW